MDLFSVVKSTKPTEVIQDSSSSNMALNSDAIFAAIQDRVKADPAKAKAVNGVFVYKITKDGKIAKEWSKLNSNLSAFQSPKSPNQSPKFTQNIYLCKVHT